VFWWWSKRFPHSLVLALLLYLGLAATTVHDVGVVGEVAASWALEAPPRVVVGWTTSGDPIWAGDHRAGPLAASQVRPTERLVLGPVSLPLAVNSYTGGPPDWPARAVYGVTGSLAAVVGLHVALGALLLVLVHRFLRFHGTDIAAALAVLALATDWSFLFYRKVLGGTELLLQAAGLLAFWALWSRRWSGGRHGAPAIAVGTGLGLMAKATFAPTLAALGIVALATRRDRPALNPPPAPRWWVLLLIVVGLTSPLWIAALHHSTVPEPHLRSHDQLTLQLGRLANGLQHLLEGRAGPSREPLSTLWAYLAHPLSWFRDAYGGSPPVFPPWRLVGWGAILAGTALEWHRRSNSPHAALLRFVSLYAPLQLGLLWLANRDLHHLAQATPTVCIWFGLAAERLVATVSQARSPVRAIQGLLICLPWMASGVWSLGKTDATLATLESPQFTEQGQLALQRGLRDQKVSRLWAADYDLYGMLEVRIPQVQVHHVWGDVSRRFSERDAALADLLRGAKGDHLLLLKPSARRIYDLSPSNTDLEQAAAQAGVQVSLVWRLRSEKTGTWARLYTVR
jgi:hypothetical protein